MSIEIVSKNNSEQHRYIPIVEAKIPQQPKAIANNERIIPFIRI